MKHLRIMVSSQARKAIVAAAVAGIAAATAAAPHGVTPLAVLTVAGAVLGAWQATYWTTNATTEPQDSTQNPLTAVPDPTPIHSQLVAEYTATPADPQ